MALWVAVWLVACGQVEQERATDAMSSGGASSAGNDSATTNAGSGGTSFAMEEHGGGGPNERGGRDEIEPTEQSAGDGGETATAAPAASAVGVRGPAIVRHYGQIACLQSMVAGKCIPGVETFAFNPAMQHCEAIPEGRCDGTDNHFDSEDECAAACSIMPRCPTGAFDPSWFGASCEGYQTEAECIEPRGYDLIGRAIFCWCHGTENMPPRWNCGG